MALIPWSNAGEAGLSPSFKSGILSHSCLLLGFGDDAAEQRRFAAIVTVTDSPSGLPFLAGQVLYTSALLE